MLSYKKTNLNFKIINNFIIILTYYYFSQSSIDSKYYKAHLAVILFSGFSSNNFIANV